MKLSMRENSVFFFLFNFADTHTFYAPEINPKMIYFSPFLRFSLGKSTQNSSDKQEGERERIVEEKSTRSQ